MTRSSLLIVPAVVFAVANGFTTRSLPTFRRAAAPLGASLTMDMEGAESNRHMLRAGLQEKLFQKSVPFPSLINKRQEQQLLDLEHAEAVLGMPWQSSIEDLDDSALLYMPFWEWQMEFLKENLTNLRVLSCTDHSGNRDFSFRENSNKGARIVNICLASDEYRKIRMTYYDAGKKTQVFNSLWYPNPSYNLPVLGIDLLQFHQKKHLAVVDFQPLHENEADHAAPFEHLLQPIRERYPSLQGKMSARFYDETQFFSKEMLFARFDEPRVVENDLFPAFQSYVKTHLELVKATKPNLDIGQDVLERQAAYDLYSAERDPATAMFEQMFGKEWADSFVYEFLFSLSQKP